MKTIKKLIVLLMCVSMLSLTACGTYVETVGNDKPSSMFVIVESNPGYWRVVYHKETKVMYVMSSGGYNTGTFTLLVNPDGTPMLWED